MVVSIGMERNILIKERAIVPFFMLIFGGEKMINWKVRIKNKAFWIALIPAVIILIQLVASLFGFEIDLSDISGKLVAIVDAVFVILAILGIVVDPTTKGFGDTKLVQGYEEPRDEEVTKVEELNG